MITIANLETSKKEFKALIKGMSRVTVVIDKYEITINASDFYGQFRTMTVDYIGELSREKVIFSSLECNNTILDLLFDKNGFYFECYKNMYSLGNNIKMEDTKTNTPCYMSQVIVHTKTKTACYCTLCNENTNIIF